MGVAFRARLGQTARMGQVSRFLKGLEWRLSLWTFIQGSSLVGSFVLPAWAVSAANLFAAYSPASWVIAGFAGLLIFSVSFALVAWGRSRWIRARYDSKMMARGAYVDSMAKTYEDQRIYLNELCLPSYPVLEQKTFINCEIIGPANTSFFVVRSDPCGLVAVSHQFPLDSPPSLYGAGERINHDTVCRLAAQTTFPLASTARLIRSSLASARHAFPTRRTRSAI